LKRINWKKNTSRDNNNSMLVHFDDVNRFIKDVNLKKDKN